MEVPDTPAAAHIVTVVLAVLLFASLGAWAAVSTNPWYPQGTLRGHQAAVVSVAISEDGTRAASLDAIGELRVWDLTGWTLLDKVQLPRHAKTV